MQDVLYHWNDVYSKSFNEFLSDYLPQIMLNINVLMYTKNVIYVIFNSGEEIQVSLGTRTRRMTRRTYTVKKMWMNSAGR